MFCAGSYYFSKDFSIKDNTLSNRGFRFMAYFRLNVTVLVVMLLPKLSVITQ